MNHDDDKKYREIIDQLNEVSFVNEPGFLGFWRYMEMFIDEEEGFWLGSDRSDAQARGALTALRSLKAKPFKRYAELERKKIKYEEYMESMKTMRLSHSIPD